jgi:hypothetical protein
MRGRREVWMRHKTTTGSAAAASTRAGRRAFQLFSPPLDSCHVRFPHLARLAPRCFPPSHLAVIALCQSGGTTLPLVRAVREYE